MTEMGTGSQIKGDTVTQCYYTEWLFVIKDSNEASNCMYFIPVFQFLKTYT